MTNYIAVIHKEKKSDFGVSFPDFPGCITAGRTVDEARDMAEEALRGHVLMMVDEGLAMPVPSTLKEILKDKNFAGEAAHFIVNIDLPKREGGANI